MNFNEIVYASRVVLNEVACIQAYGWSDEFARKEVTEALTKFQERVGKLDVQSFTRDELFTLGFANWDGKILLIPFYLLPCIPSGTKVYDINDREHIIGKAVLHNDVRFGCLAYGIKLDDSVLALEEGTKLLEEEQYAIEHDETNVS